MQEKTKNVLNFIGRFGISIILLLWIFKSIDFEKTMGVIESANILYLVLTFIVFCFISFLLLLRWFILIRALGLTVNPKDVVRYFFIGLFGNLFLPSAIGGDIIKILGLCKDSSQKAKVVASVLLDRLTGFAAISIVALTSFIFGFRYINDPSLIAPILILGVGSVLLAAVLFNERIYSFICRIFSKLPKLKHKLMNLHYDIALIKGHKKKGFVAIGIACCCQVIYATVFFMISQALHQDINLFYFIIFVPLLCVATSLPSIGGLGVQEAGAAYFFSKVGVDAGIAVSISLMVQFFKILMGLSGGVFYVFTLSSGRIQHNSSDASEP